MKNIKNTILLFLFRLLYAGIFLCAVFLNFSAFLGISIVTWRHMSVLLVALIALLLFRTVNGKIRLQLTGLFWDCSYSVYVLWINFKMAVLS